MYNSYLNNNSPLGQSYLNYGGGNYNAYPNMQQPQQRPYPMQQPQQVQDMPFREVRYGTLDEAKANLVMPNQAIMIINRNLGEFYIKSANGRGEPTVEAFKYSKLEDNSQNPQTTNFDPNNFVKKGDLTDFITKEDLKNVDSCWLMSKLYYCYAYLKFSVI